MLHTEFGMYVDRHGDPSRRMGTVEWEGWAERAAWHPPYILLFNSQFIEVRHVQTGHLVQIISGNDIRCTWDGRGTSQSQAISEGSWVEVNSPELRIHAVMNLDSSQPERRGATAQHLFELIPKIPSYSSGSLASSSHVSSEATKVSDTQSVASEDLRGQW